MAVSVGALYGKQCHAHLALKSIVPEALGADWEHVLHR